MMTLKEARDIAYEGNHATVTFHLAATVIRTQDAGRDAMAYAQLAEMKAAIQSATEKSWDYFQRK